MLKARNFSLLPTISDLAIREQVVRPPLSKRALSYLALGRFVGGGACSWAGGAEGGVANMPMPEIAASISPQMGSSSWGRQMVVALRLSCPW